MKNIDLLLKCLEEELADTGAIKDTLAGLATTNHEILETLLSLKGKEQDIVSGGFVDDANRLVAEHAQHDINIKHGTEVTYVQLKNNLKTVFDLMKKFKAEKDKMLADLNTVKVDIKSTRTRCLSLQDKVTPVVGRGGAKKVKTKKPSPKSKRA